MRCLLGESERTVATSLALVDEDSLLFLFRNEDGGPSACLESSDHDLIAHDVELLGVVARSVGCAGCAQPERRTLSTVRLRAEA